MKITRKTLLLIGGTGLLILFLTKRSKTQVIASGGFAEFSIGELVINPELVRVGEPVNVGITVSNIGTASGSYVVTLSGDFSEEQTRTLKPGQSAQVVFTLVPTEPRIHTISVNGFTGTFVAADAVIGITNYFWALYTGASSKLYEEPPFDSINSAIEGERVSLWVQVTNYGEVSGSRTISAISTSGTSTHTVKLEPGESVWLQFVYTTSGIENIYVELDDMMVTLPVY